MSTHTPDRLLRLFCSAVALFAALAASAEAATTEFQLKLSQGENHVSIPGTFSNSVQSVFGPVLDKVESINYYDAAARSWLSYDPDAPGNTLEEIPLGRAFVITVSEEMSVKLVVNDEQQVSVDMQPGWNPFGVARAITPRNLDANGVISRYVPAYDVIYMVGTKGLTPVGLDEELQPGSFYWLDNDPDGDGVASMEDESPLQKNVEVHLLGMSVDLSLKTVLNAEKMDLIRSKCGSAYTPGDNLDSMYLECQRQLLHVKETCGYTSAPGEDPDLLAKSCKAAEDKFNELKKAYSLPGTDVQLGDFVVTEVWYKTDESGKKVEGIGRIQNQRMPSELKPLFAIEEGSTPVVIDIKDGETITGIYSRNVQGLRLGSGGNLLMLNPHANTTTIEYLSIDQTGALECELSAELGDLPKRNYFVMWVPKVRHSSIQIKPKESDGPDIWQEFAMIQRNYIQLGMVLGDDVVASRVWEQDGDTVRERGEGDSKWLINFPPGAKGLFEPVVKKGSEELSIAFSDSPDYWLPASVEQKETNGKKILSFSAAINGVDWLSGLHKGVIPPDDSYKSVTITEEGEIETVAGNTKLQYKEGSFVFGDKNEIFQGFMKGWSLKPTAKPYYVTKHAAAGWTPSFAFRIGTENKGVVKDVGIAGSLSIGILRDLYKNSAEKQQPVTGSSSSFIKKIRTKLADFSMSSVDFDYLLKLVLDFEGPQIDLECGGGLKLEVLKKEGDIKTFLVTATSSGVFPLALDDPDNKYDLKIKATAVDSWIAQTGSTARRGYKRAINLDGFGRIRFPDSMPLIGGQDLSAEFLGNLTSTGGYTEGKQTYAVTKRATARLGEDAVKQYGGWQFSLDEITVQFEEGRIERSSFLDADLFGSGAEQSSGISVVPNPFAGAWLVPETMWATAKSGWKPSRFTGYATVAPPNGWKFGGPFEALVLVEKKKDTAKNQEYWATTVTADMDLKIPMGGENYLMFKQLMLTMTGGHEWLRLADAELHVADGTYAATVLFKDDGSFTVMVKGYNLGEAVSSADVMFDVSEGTDKNWTWTAGVGAALSKEWLAARLGVDKERIVDDLFANGVYRSDGTIVLQLGNVPLPFLTSALPPWMELERVRNVMVSKTADKKWDFMVEADFLFPKLTDTEDLPREQWPRFTLSVLAGSSGVQVSGKNLEINAGNENTIIVTELTVAKGKEDWKGELQLEWQPNKDWIDSAAPYGRLPDKIKGMGEITSAGYMFGFKWDPAPVINLGGSNTEIKMKEVFFKKMSPWSSGIGSTLTIGGQEIDGVVEIGKKSRFVPSDTKAGFTVDLTGGYKVTVSNLAIDLGTGFAMSGDALITMPDGNVMNGIVGNSFAAKVSGSPEKYSFSTDTNISSTMEMGLLGKASFTITSLSLSSDGSFAGSGRMTLAGQTTAFVIGTKGGGIYFMADFGAAGIDIKLAQIFMLKVKNKIGLESLGAYQYVRVDDMKTALGNETAGADLATSKFLYFLPSSVPPVGFAFFDNLEGKVSIAGFAVGLGMSFPAPGVKDLGTVMGLLAQAFTGGTVDFTKLETLSAPAFGLNNVAVQFPKVPGFKWDNGLKPTDNVFAAMFGSDRLTLASNKSLKPKDFIQAVTADSTLDIIKVVTPGDIRKGSLNMNILGFKAGVNYDLREDQTTYEQKPVDKLPDMYRYLNKVRYVDQHDGGLPAELQGSGGTAAQTAGITGNYTELKAKHSGKCLDVSGVSTSSGAIVHQWEFVNNDNQFWKLIPDSGGYYRIEAKHSGKCLDVSAGGTQNGAKIQQSDCAGTDSQKWKPIAKGDNYYQLQAKHSGKCLDVAAAGNKNGTGVQQWDCGSGDNQKWLISQGAGGSRSKTVQVAMPAEHGGGTAKVTWTVEDIATELKTIKEVLAAVTPPASSTWQSHFSHLWNQFSSKGLTFSGNRATFQYSPTVAAELEMTEYDGDLDVTGLKKVNNQLSARFGSATLYADKNFEGKSLAVSDDVSYYTLNAGIGNDNLSSVKIEGRGKIKLFQHASNQGNVTEVTGSLDSLDDSAVKDNDASSIQVYFPISTGSVTGWRLILKFSKGIVTTVDAGGIEVVFPGDQKVLGLLPNSRMVTAIADTGKALADLKPFPDINKNPTGFLTSFWENKVLPIKANFMYGSEDDLEAADKPVQFKKSDNSIIGFQPLIYGTDRKVNGIRFNKDTGVLTGKFGKATLYADSNYGGKSLVVEDDIPDLAGKEVGNDQVSSIKVEDNGSVMLYSGTNYTERWYYNYKSIKAKHSGKAMDESTTSGANGGNIHQWDFLNNNNQLWKLVPADGDYFRIVAKHSGKCVDVSGAGTHNGANIHQWDCHEGDNQKWKLVPKGGNSYQLKSKHSGKCIDVEGAWGHNGANIHQWDCHEGLNQRWLMDLDKITFSTTGLEASDTWIGDNGIKNDTVRSVRVFHPLDIDSIKEWRIQQSTPSGGTVTLAYSKDTSDGRYKSIISTELSATGNKLFSYYDDNGNLTIKAFSKSEAEFPLTNYRALVKGTPYDLTDIVEAAKYIRVVTKTIALPDKTTVVINDDGGIFGAHRNVAIAPAEGSPAETVFTLPGPDGMNLRFTCTKTGGVGNPEVTGSNPVQYALLYRDGSGVPLGIKKAIGQIPGGFFLDAGLNLGTSNTVQLNLLVSGAVKTDGNFYLKGNGNLVIASYTVSEAIVELSSDNGLAIRGKMDLFGSKVDIQGYLKPDGVFSFTGVAQVMVSGTGVKGSLAVNNSGVNINGGIYITNQKIVGGVFTIKDSKVSWKTNVSIGFAGFDSTTWIQLKNPYGPGYEGRAYLDVDVPIYVWGPKGWRCKKRWGIKICWPSGWGNIRVGTLPLHFNQAVSGSMSGTALKINLGPAALSVDVAKPSVKASW